MITPPTIGPRTGPSGMTTPISPITRPTREGPAVRASSVSMIGSSMPPPKPWITRKMIRVSIEGASPLASEPTRKTDSPASHIRRLPNRSVAQALSGMATVTASR